jgi:membrane protein required for colicin V production
VALLFFNWLAGAKAPAWVTEAKSRPLLEQIGAKLESLLPADTENAILKKLSPKAGAETPAAPDAPAADVPATGDDANTPAPDDNDAGPADNTAKPAPAAPAAPAN